MTAGANPIPLQRGIMQAVEVIVEELKKISKKVSNRKEIAQVATVSANWDTTIGDIIADAMDKVGKDGTITVEEAKGIETTLEVVEGMQFDKGYLSPYFVTNAESMEAVLENAYILIHEKKITSLKRSSPASGKGREGWPPVARYRRGRRRRSARDARGKQAAGHHPSCRSGSSRLRRPPQSDA